VLANPVRLRVLRHVCRKGEACVSATARACRLPMSSATNALRALQARGLLGVRREGLFVIYYAHADESVEHAAAVLAAVRRVLDRRVADRQIIRTVTAFTHVRRILIVQALAAAPADAAMLSVTCGISLPALYRHMVKLERRGLIEAVADGTWRLAQPDGSLARALLGLVSSGRRPSSV
jgi:DNA-binding transcriptional ArsR family regulator